MPKVILKKGVGKHRLRGGRLVEPGQEIELSDEAYACFKDKFDRSLSAEELAEMAKKKAEQELQVAKEAEKRAEAASKEAAAKAAAAKKSGNQGKG